MKIDHVTYQVPFSALFHDEGKRTGQYTEFFVDLLEMKEIDPDEGIEGKGWKVRWFEDSRGFKVHLVEPKQDGATGVELALGHFCAIIGRSAYKKALESQWREDIGSLHGRAWLRGPGGIRVEIRPTPLRLPHPGEEGGGSLRGLDELASVDWGSLGPGDTEKKMIAVFNQCLRIFNERNKQHKDSWKREGWRGCLFNLRRKVERAWDHLWYLETQVEVEKDVDDILDSINYAVLTVLAVEEGNRDGTAGWWG